MLTGVRQQNAVGEIHPTIEEVATSICASSVNHDVEIGSIYLANDIIIAFVSLANGGGIVEPDFPWVSFNLYSSSSTGLTMAAYMRIVDGMETTPVNFVSNVAGPLVAQVFRIGATTINEMDVTGSGVFDSFTPPTLTPAWGDDANLWISAVHSSMSGSFTSHPAGFSDLLSTVSGTTSTDAQLHTCLLYNRSTSESPSAWSFSSPSGKYGVSHVAIRGGYILGTE